MNNFLGYLYSRGGTSACQKSSSDIYPKASSCQEGLMSLLEWPL